MLKNPQVSVVEKQTNKRDVIATEASRFFPGVAVSEETDDRGGMPGSAAGLFAPDADFDETSANFVDWLFCHVLHHLRTAVCLRARIQNHLGKVAG